jgi:hypothetical protein
MPEPLDYESCSPQRPARPVVPPPAAVPAQFRAQVTTSDDHAGVRSVEAALNKAGIGFFRAEGDARVVGRPVTLWCAEADCARAMAIAAEVFARRAKVRKAAPPRSDLTDHMTRDEPWGDSGSGLGGW